MQGPITTNHSITIHAKAHLTRYSCQPFQSKSTSSPNRPKAPVKQECVQHDSTPSAGVPQSDRQNINSLRYQAVLPKALLRNLLETCGTPWNTQNLLLPEFSSLLGPSAPSEPSTFTSKNLHFRNLHFATPPGVTMFWAASGPTQTYLAEPLSIQASFPEKHPDIPPNFRFHVHLH